MATDQIELLTQDIQSRTPPNAKDVLDSLPVKSPAEKIADSFLDSVVKENADPSGESPVIQAFLTLMNWAAIALAIGAVLFLTWSAGDGIVKYLGHQ